MDASRRGVDFEHHAHGSHSGRRFTTTFGALGFYGAYYDPGDYFNAEERFFPYYDPPNSGPTERTSHPAPIFRGPRIIDVDAPPPNDHRVCWEQVQTVRHENGEPYQVRILRC
jgi:hypothetical protein